MLFGGLLGLMLVSCGGGHKEYTINAEEIPISSRIADRFDFDVYDENHVLSQIFEIEPGTYTITADKNAEGVTSGSDVNVTLKFKLLRPVSYNEGLHDFDLNLHLIDADNKLVKDGTIGVSFPLNLGRYESKSNGSFLVKNEEVDKDALVEFMDFLQSEPGTVAEFTFGNFYGMDMANCLKDVTGFELYLNPGLAEKDGKTLYQYNWSWK